MAIALVPSAVLSSTAALMAFRLRISGFQAGQGGVEVAMFTDATTPNVTRATEVTARNSGRVSDDFPAAGEGDEPGLRSLAALRSAIELELSVPNPDYDRVREWREQVKDLLTSAPGGSGSGPGDGTGGMSPAARWYFGEDCGDHVPGAEEPYPSKSPSGPPVGRRHRW